MRFSLSALTKTVNRDWYRWQPMMLQSRNYFSNFDFFAAHCLKSVQIQSFFWSVFSCIRTEYSLYFPYSEYSSYSLYSRSIQSISSIQSEYRKIRTRKNSIFGHFSRIGKNLIRKSFLNISAILVYSNTLTIFSSKKIWLCMVMEL